MAQAVRELLADRARQPAVLRGEARPRGRSRVDRSRQPAARAPAARRRTLGDRRASLENVWCEPARGLDKAVVRQLATCQWVRAEAERHRRRRDRRREALPRCRARAGRVPAAASARSARACRASSHELAIARADGPTPRCSRKSRASSTSLVLDDFLIAPLKDTERRDLLEVLEDRYDRSSTVITSQVPTKSWHEMLADPTIADAICDRLVHNAHVVALKGPSGRRRRDSRSSRPNPPREPHPSLRSEPDVARRFAPTAPKSTGTSARITPERAPESSGIRTMSHRPRRDRFTRGASSGMS